MACWGWLFFVRYFPFKRFKSSALSRRVSQRKKAKFGVFLIDLLISQKEQKSFEPFLTFTCTVRKVMVEQKCRAG